MKQVADPVTAHYDMSLGLARLCEDIAPLAVHGVKLRIAMTADGKARSFIGEVAFSVEFGKLLVSYWCDEASESWRITAYECSGETIRLKVSRRMGKMGGLMAISRQEAAPPFLTLNAGRREFFLTFCNILRGILPGVKIPRRANSARESKYCPSHVARLAFSYQNVKCLAAGVSECESQKNIDAILGVVVRLVSENETRREPFRRVLLFVPSGRAKALAERLSLVTLPHVELYAFQEADALSQRIAPSEQLALMTGPARYAQALEIQSLGEREQKLYHDAFSSYFERVHIVPALRRQTFRILWNGLECARLYSATVRRPAFISFGLSALGERMRTLSEKTEAEFLSMLAQLCEFRSHTSRVTQHPLYRAQPERWLEAVVQRHPAALDARLHPQFFYSQAPAFSLTDGGYADGLGVTRDGRLAVVELKANLDSELLWQGLEYWRRVRAHQARGDFVRCGFFTGLGLDASLLPALYLVAPMLRLHRSLRAACRVIDRKVPIRVIGISENWRRELRTIFREEFDSDMQ